MCTQWTLPYVAGHVIWGQEQLRHWATGQQYGRTDGAPGAAHPGDLAGANPVETFRGVRAAALESLTREALGRTVRLPGIGDQALASTITLLITDHLAHAWDIAYALQLDIHLDTDLVAGSLAWAHDNIVRVPGFFGKAVEAAAIPVVSAGCPHAALRSWNPRRSRLSPAVQVCCGPTRLTVTRPRSRSSSRRPRWLSTSR